MIHNSDLLSPFFIENPLQNPPLNLFYSFLGQFSSYFKRCGKQINQIILMRGKLHTFKHKERDGGIRNEAVGILLLPLEERFGHQELIAGMSQDMAELMEKIFPLLLGRKAGIDIDAVHSQSTVDMAALKRLVIHPDVHS